LDIPDTDNRKRANQYEAAFRTQYHIGFNKRRVAEAAKKLLSEQREDPATRDSLGRLSTAIIAALAITDNRGAVAPTTAVRATARS
jgi:rRNA maturation endonuclease Nob1